jgi:hypothetical protein
MILCAAQLTAALLEPIAPPCCCCWNTRIVSAWQYMWPDNRPTKPDNNQQLAQVLFLLVLFLLMIATRHAGYPRCHSIEVHKAEHSMRINTWLVQHVTTIYVGVGRCRPAKKTWTTVGSLMLSFLLSCVLLVVFVILQRSGNSRMLPGSSLKHCTAMKCHMHSMTVFSNNVCFFACLYAVSSDPLHLKYSRLDDD